MFVLYLLEVKQLGEIFANQSSKQKGYFHLDDCNYTTSNFNYPTSQKIYFKLFVTFKVNSKNRQSFITHK